MSYFYPFGEAVRPLVQEDRTPKKVFVLGVYASAVHANWKCKEYKGCPALAVASEPRIFWDGDIEEAKRIISKIKIPKELGTLEPAKSDLNGPSGKVLEEHILKPLGFNRDDAWLCDLLPETRLNPRQAKVIEERYNPLIEKYGLNKVTIPTQPSIFCDKERAEEITVELLKSETELIVLLGDIPIAQYLRRVADVPYKTLGEYVTNYGYGTITEVIISGKTFRVLPVTHPRQIGALGAYSKKWHDMHKEWERKRQEK